MTGGFVDRIEESRVLTAFAGRLLRGSGGMLAVEGHAGTGKSELIKEFERTQAGPRMVMARCHGQDGAENSYGPISDLLTRAATQQSVRGRWRRHAAPLLRAAPQLLELVPTVGPALRAGVEAVQHRGDGESEDVLLGQTGRVARVLADALVSAARDRGPLLCVIDDAERIDPSSCLVLDYLSEQLPTVPLGIILVHRSTVWETEGHPLISLLRQFRSRRQLQTIRLQRLPASAVAQYARRRGETGTDEEVLARVDSLVGGHALLLVQLMDLRQENATKAGTLNLDDNTLDAVDAVVCERLDLLPPDARHLLEIAAIQGTVFSTSIVREVSGLGDEEVGALLGDVERRGDLIEAVSTPIAPEPTEAGRYRFAHGMLQLLLYRRQNDHQRRNRHRAIASALERLGEGAAATVEPLQLARHHRGAGDARKAAEYSYLAAQRMARSGSALTEVSVLCARALSDLRAAPDGPDTDRWALRVLELLLVASESSWQAAEDAEAGVLGLAEEAARTAQRIGEPRLQARAAFLYGKILLHTQGVTTSTSVLHTALERAEADDGLPEASPERFLLMTEYGAQLTQRDLAAGLRLMRRADLLRQTLASWSNWVNDPVTALVERQLDKQFGVSALDAGDLGNAHQRLTQSVEQLRIRAVADELHPALNYLAQTLIAMGEYARAEAALHEALDLVRTPGPSAWRAYHRSLLGRAFLLDDKGEQALHLLRSAADECDRTQIVSIGPLVHNYLAEALIVLGAGDRRRLAEAEEISVATADACRAAGTLRSEVTAWSLVGRARLLLGSLDSARHAGEQAVTLLQQAGGHLPAVTAEEIYYHHSRTLTALGETADGLRLLRAANEEIQRKAATLNPNARARFLTAVALNRAVAENLAAHQPEGQPNGLNTAAAD
ncbi:ATP-binding protein [Streptomyces griseoluteus]|uniref:ATP-binding protein n=1 Tax=Streptomyces griseoluteus TaxID=29306 RepID=UPI00341F2783